MRLFTITYDRGGGIAVSTVQGNEIVTVDDFFCVREHGVPLATFPKQDVLHVTTNGPGADRPAPVTADLGKPARGPRDAHAEPRYWRRLRTALDPTTPGEIRRMPAQNARAATRTAPDPTTRREPAARVARRAPAGGEIRRRQPVAS